MDLTLYDGKISGNSYKVRLVLAQLELPHQLVPLDLLKGEARTPEFRAVSPFGRVPYLRDGDFGLGESNAILLYLARGSGLLPDDARKQALIHQWMFFEQNQLEPAIGLSRYIRRFLPAELPGREAILDYWKPRALSSLKALERRLLGSPWVAGAEYSVADIAVFGYVPLAAEGDISLEPFPSVRAWIERVRRTPRFVEMGS